MCPFVNTLCQTNKTSTLRDVFYSAQAFDIHFKDQRESDNIITDLESMINFSRGDFHVFPEERSQVFGDLTIEYTVPNYEGRQINLTMHPDGVAIGPALTTAELIKTTIGNAYSGDKVEHMQIKGRDLATGIPKIIGIDSDEVRKATTEQIRTILETVKVALEQTPPELAADIFDNGIVLTGGGALLKNLDMLLREETGLPITITEDPLTTVVLGSGKALDEIDLLRDVMI